MSTLHVPVTESPTANTATPATPVRRAKTYQEYQIGYIRERRRVWRLRKQIKQRMRGHARLLKKYKELEARHALLSVVYDKLEKRLGAAIKELLCG